MKKKTKVQDELEKPYYQTRLYVQNDQETTFEYTAKDAFSQAFAKAENRLMDDFRQASRDIVLGSPPTAGRLGVGWFITEDDVTIGGLNKEENKGWRFPNGATVTLMGRLETAEEDARKFQGHKDKKEGNEEEN